MRVATSFLLCVLPVCAAPSDSQIHSAAANAIARLQASQKNWYDNDSCSSCHHQFLPALAFREARLHGIPVDEGIAGDDARRAFAVYADLDQAVEHAHLVDPVLGHAYGLIAADAVGVRPSIVTAVYARFLAQRQKPDGHWTEFDERPPQSYSPVTATALAIRVLTIYSHPSLQADTRARIERARQWLLACAPRDTEERTFQLLGLKWATADRTELDRRAKELEAIQQADGGWNSLNGRAGDAYSTGEALAALEEIGVSGPVIERGVEFLLKTQKPDGTWHVPTRLYPPAPLSPDYFESGYPYAHDQFISAMGASWAIMALARALGPGHEVNTPPLAEAAPSKVDPWVETLLFGSSRDLQALLDKGFDPNSMMKSGATALILAAPDPSKLKLLLDHGAKINARSKNGYSALMYTALYSNSTPALKLLLDRGATLNSDGALFHAYPAALATIAGNAEGVILLHKAGGDVNAIYNCAGIQPAPPLILISTFGDVPVARALIESGASVNAADGDGLTALQWATLANQVEMAKLLIEHDADVNHVDKHGMTPLLYAASVDFGDDAMIRLLLEHRASANAKSPEGLTALQLAQKYRHKHLLKALGG